MVAREFDSVEAEKTKAEKPFADVQKALENALRDGEKRWIRLNMLVDKGRIASVNLVEDHSYSLDIPSGNGINSQER